MAAGVVAGGGVGKAARLLEEATGGRPGHAGVADRPSAASRAKLSRGADVGRLAQTLVDGVEGTEPGRRRNLVHDAARRFPDTRCHCYSGSDQIVVGSPIAGRHRPELEQLIGLFVNTLVMRGDLSGDPSFRMLLARTREAALGAYAHQDLPFEKLVEELTSGSKHESCPALPGDVRSAECCLGRARSLSGLEVAPVPVDIDVSKFDLTLSVRERDGCLKIGVEYSTDLFEAETIRRMLGHYQTLLEGIVANPDGRLSDLPLLTETERSATAGGVEPDRGRLSQGSLPARTL